MNAQIAMLHQQMETDYALDPLFQRMQYDLETEEDELLNYVAERRRWVQQALVTSF